MSEDEKRPHGYRAPCPRCIEESPISRALWADISTPRDWPTFWQSLTPEECRDALRAAPRVAGEWINAAGGWTRSRVPFGGIICETGDREFWVYLEDLENENIHGTARNAESARKKADAALRQAGWVLL